MDKSQFLNWKIWTTHMITEDERAVSELFMVKDCWKKKAWPLNAILFRNTSYRKEGLACSWTKTSSCSLYNHTHDEWGRASGVSIVYGYRLCRKKNAWRLSTMSLDNIHLDFDECLKTTIFNATLEKQMKHVCFTCRNWIPPLQLCLLII